MVSILVELPVAQAFLPVCSLPEYRTGDRTRNASFRINILAMAFYRRNLPHWQPDGVPLFVTWRLHGSLPASVHHQQTRSQITPAVRPSFPGSRFLADDHHLDQAKLGPVWLKDPRIARVLVDALHFGESNLRLYELYAYVVMANHIHVLLRPSVPLERITKLLKGFTARQANRILGRTGQRFWQEESYDHWVRNEAEFSRIATYVEHNPVSAGLLERPEDWPWSSAHK